MAKPKSKSGKKGKAAPKKATVKRVRKAVVAAAAPAKAQSAQSYPCLVHVKKGAETIPVQVKDAAHHAQLAEEFGAAHIEVQK